MRWCSSDGAARKSGASKLFASRSSGNHQDHSTTTRIAPTPPAITAGTGPISAPRKPDFGLAQLVGGGNEERRHRADPAAHCVRRVELDQRLADVDREHVGRAEQCQADQRQRHRAREAEDDRRGSEHAHRDQHLHADIVLQRAKREESGGQGRPECGGGAQMTETLRSGVQHVAGEDRQHCRRSAQQHREQIEADCPEHESVLPDVVQALDHLLPRVGATVESRCGASGRSRTGPPGRQRTAACSRRKARTVLLRKDSRRSLGRRSPRSATRSRKARWPGAGFRAGRGSAPALQAPARQTHGQRRAAPQPRRGLAVSSCAATRTRRARPRSQAPARPTLGRPSAGRRGRQSSR